MGANPDVSAILSSLLAGQTTFQKPATIQTPDLASILQSLSRQPPPPPPPPPPVAVQPQQPNIPVNIDLSALLSQFQQHQQPPAPAQRWTSPPPSTSRTRWDERPRETTTEKAKIKRDVGSRIKASRLDDVRDSVRNSTADQNMYRALCQFYVLPPLLAKTNAG
jgi:hypothetical protein